MWHPSASFDSLKARAEILTQIRYFFKERNVFEVETPLLSHSTVSDPHIATIWASHQHTRLYLQTSPEYAMKRLLAAGSGSIFQICKAFRNGDIGARHNPEFTLLEWYQVGFDHHALMNEMDELLQYILKTKSADRISCEELFQSFLKLSPHTSTLEELKHALKKEVNYSHEKMDRNTCLELLFTHCIEPYIAKEHPLFLYDFPISQAALAKIRLENPPVASRFEVYFKGLELANGFHELQDAVEQRARFEKDLQYRQKNNLPIAALDENFLAALNHGLPPCAGVALGVDRLVMLALGANQIGDVISFRFEQA